MLMLKPFLMRWHCPQLMYMADAVSRDENMGLHTCTPEWGSCCFLGRQVIPTMQSACLHQSSTVQHHVKQPDDGC